MRLNTIAVAGGGGGSKRLAFVLHGILGSAKNWRSFGRLVVNEYPGWRVLLVDLRNHGESPRSSFSNSLVACADDLRELADDLGESPSLVLGHSFGGKVALQYAAMADESLEQTWVLDADPGAPAEDLARVSSRHVVRVLEALPGIPQPLESREALVKLLREQGFTEDLAAWMTTNLRREADGYHWRFDLEGVLDMVADYARSDFFPDLEAGHFGGRIDIVRAARTRWPNYDLNRLRGLEARSGGRFGYHVLHASGHWVHIDNPAGLLDLLRPTLGSA